MKKKIALLMLFIMVFFAMMGCGSNALSYDGNLGYNFDKVKCEKLVFKVYHSNTKDHMWEEIAEFPYTPTKNETPDIRVDGAKDKVTVVLEKNNYVEQDKSGVYNTKDMESYAFDVDGFEGNILSYHIYDVKDITDEQLYRLYPISNDKGVTYEPTIDLAKPYDEDQANLDNVLITLTIER